MARARNIKPGFFSNEDLAECSFEARLCFAGLWTLADRDGRLEDRPKRIKGELFRYDSVEVEPMLVELAHYGFILRYQVDGVSVIQVIEFMKHQNPHHREADSALPPPPSPGLLPDAKVQKPQAQLLLHDGEAREEPRIEGHEHDLERGSNRADSLIPDSLIPDPGSLIPDSPSLFPEGSPLRSELSPGVSAEAPPPPPASTRKSRKPKPPKEPPPSSAAWDAYAKAYERRYRAAPVRNAAVNGQLAMLVARLGAEEAPLVAAFFVGHRNALYVNAMHPVNLLLRDAEKLRTEWATNRQMTRTQAAQADKTQTNANAFAGMLAEARARESEET